MFQAYKSSRAFEDIAQEIRVAILSKKLADGDRLPSERELAEQFQVGRVTIREALRMLETMGLIQIRKGSAGGAFVQVAEPQVMASLMIDRLQLKGTTSDQMTEARLGLECAIVKTAILHATDADLDRIAENVEASREIIDPPLSKKVVAKMINFHILIAEATHNLPYIMFLSSAMEWASRMLVDWVPTADEQVFAYESHKEIFEAILKKDEVLAEKLMGEHVIKMDIMVSKLFQES